MYRRTLRTAIVFLVVLSAISLSTYYLRYATHLAPGSGPENAPSVRVELGKLIELRGDFKGEAWWKLTDIRPGYDLRINVSVEGDDAHYEAALYDPKGARLSGEDKIGSKLLFSLRYVFGRGNVSYAHLRLAGYRGLHEAEASYVVKILAIGRFDAGTDTDAGEDFETAIDLGTLKQNRSIGANGYLVGRDYELGMDARDVYKIHLDIHGDGILNVTVKPLSGRPLLEVTTRSADGFRVGWDRADNWTEPVSAVTRFSNASPMDIYIEIDAEHECNYQLIAVLTGYEQPQPPSTPPIQPPTDFLPYFWILVILLILLAFWIIGLRPRGKLKELADKIDKAYKPIEKAARKIMRCEEPAPINPVATKAIAKYLTAVFLFSSGALEAWIIALGLLPAALIYVDQWYRLFTYWMLHANLAHLVGNLAFFLTMSPWLEYRWKRLKLFLYFILPFNLGAVAAHIVWAYFTGLMNVYCIGASGAISGVAGAFYMLYPDKKFIVFGKKISAKTYLSLWFALNLAYALFNAGGGVAYFAHVGGFLAGMVVGGLEARRGERA